MIQRLCIFYSQYWCPNLVPLFDNVSKRPDGFLVRRSDEIGPQVASVEEHEDETEQAVKEDQVET